MKLGGTKVYWTRTKPGERHYLTFWRRSDWGWKRRLKVPLWRRGVA